MSKNVKISRKMISVYFSSEAFGSGYFVCRIVLGFGVLGTREHRPFHEFSIICKNFEAFNKHLVGSVFKNVQKCPWAKLVASALCSLNNACADIKTNHTG